MLCCAVSVEMSKTENSASRVDVDKPRWDQTTFVGRLKHFAWITDFRNVLVPSTRLHESKHLLQLYRYHQFVNLIFLYNKLLQCLWCICSNIDIMLLHFLPCDARSASAVFAIVMSSVRLSVTLVYCGHIGWTSSKLIARIISLGSTLLGATTSAI